MEKINDHISQSLIIDVINNREDLQKILFGSTDIVNNIQEGINLIVTNDKLNDAIVHHKLDTVLPNVLRRQNPYEAFLKIFRNLIDRILLLIVC